MANKLDHFNEFLWHICSGSFHSTEYLKFNELIYVLQLIKFYYINMLNMLSGKTVVRFLFDGSLRT